jgi:putative membrane protein
MKRAPFYLPVAGVIAAMAWTPAWAISLSAAGPAQPIPDASATPASLTPAETLTAGSASLVPLMATDMQAGQITTVDAPATGGSDVGKPIDDITFVRKATESGYKEVNSAKEAIPQLQQPELKRIAEMLVTDHSGANARLAKLAESKHWTLPAAPRAGPPPSGTASINFDAKWTAEMIAAHERSVAMYRAQAQSGEDPDLRKYARETLPTIEHHLAELRRLQK